MIVSDSHRERRNLYRVLEREKPIDLLVHCGDIQMDEMELEKEAECEIVVVAGNMDFGAGLPREKVFQIGAYKVFLTHGHLYGAHFDDGELRRAGEEEGADIVMFGHTHCPQVKRYGDMVILNPGSIAFPRQEDGRPTYAVMTVDEAGEAHYEIKYV